MYVCKMRVKDAAYESRFVCATVQTIFLARAAMSPALHPGALRIWNRLNEVFHYLLCYEMCYVTTTPFLQPGIRRWWYTKNYLTKYVNQPQILETHRHHRHSNRCRFAMNLHTLFPTLGQSSCSWGHRLVDSLSGHATRAFPPSKKLTGWAPELVANTKWLHACDFATTWVGQPMKSYWFHRIAYITQWIAV